MSADGIVEFRPKSAVDRKFGLLLLLSLLIHLLAGLVALHRREAPPPPPTLLATIRLIETALAKPASAPAAEAAPSATRRALPPPQARQAANIGAERPVPRSSIPVGPATAPGAEPAPAVGAAAAAAETVPARAAEAPPLAATAAADALAGYRRQLTDLFARQHSYPRIAAMRGWEGEVRLRLKVARKGNLVDVQLDRSSGFDVLDRDALALLEGYGSLPPLPESIELAEISVVVPINYKLKKTT